MMYFIVPIVLNMMYGILAFFGAKGIAVEFFLLMEVYNCFLNPILIAFFVNKKLNQSKHFWILSVVCLTISVLPTFLIYLPFVIKDGLLEVIASVSGSLNEAILAYYRIILSLTIISLYILSKVVQLKLVPFFGKFLKNQTE